MTVNFLKPAHRAAPDTRRATLPVETETPVHLARELTKDGSVAFICHQDKVYTLRITRAGKLILTK